MHVTASCLTCLAQYHYVEECQQTHTSGGLDSADKSIAGLKNILRGCLLAFLATFAGCFLFFTLPDLVASKIGKQLPYWFYANEVRIFVLPVCL